MFIDMFTLIYHVHVENFAHNDVKPGNLMFDKKGLVKLIDFGETDSLDNPNLNKGTA